MKILWLAWKDYTHPERGGAELTLSELMQRQVADGHSVTLLTARHDGSAAHETMDGIEIIRVGNNRYIHPIQALAYYLRHLRGKFDILIETVNTAPYFGLLFPGRAKPYALYHQLAREIWFFETKLPVNYVGFYLIEPFSTWLLGRARAPLITVSESTKRDMARFGWKPERTRIISEGIEIKPIATIDAAAKYTRPTVLSLGAMRGMKRTLDQIQGFELAKKHIPKLQMKVAGDASSPYGQQVLAAIQKSPYRDDIEYLGRVSTAKKIELMRKSHVITVTSVKEGWGLIVTEAASQGTPAVVYDADGLRDSVRHSETGLVTRPTPESLSQGIIELLTNHQLYGRLQKEAWEWSKTMTFDRSYNDLKQTIGDTSMKLDTTYKPIVQNMRNPTDQYGSRPLVSIIVTTRNNHETLDACLASIYRQTYQPIELIVVDRDSTDGTKLIARFYTDKVYNCGPERSAQRNFGVSKASGEYVLIVDSDMELTPDVVQDCMDVMWYKPEAKGIIIPEESFGRGFWARCKQLERSFYHNNDAIEAARFFAKSTYSKVGGYDESMVSGEDWDLSARVRNLGRIERINSLIRHNEGRFKLIKSLKKKYYYAGQAKAYLQKNQVGSKLTASVGPLERYKLFLGQPRKLFGNPAVGLGMLFMKTFEYGSGALGYLFSSKRERV